MNLRRTCWREHPNPTETQGICGLCKLYVTNSQYRDYWDKAEKPPTAAEQIARFADAMREEWRWRREGGKKPTKSEKMARRASCDGCNLRDHTNDSCTMCGCYLEKGLFPPRPLGKLDCSTQSCPIGKWSYAGGYMPKNGGCGKCGGRTPTVVVTVSGSTETSPEAAPEDPHASL